MSRPRGALQGGAPRQYRGGARTVVRAEQRLRLALSETDLCTFREKDTVP